MILLSIVPSLTHTHIHTHTCMHAHSHTRVHAHTRAHAHTYARMHMHTNNIRKFEVRTTKESTKTQPKDFWCLTVLTINKWHGIVDKFSPV